MKSSSTSFSISSSSTSASFDVNAFSSKGLNLGCAVGILRRILCFNSLPTRPSDRIIEADARSYNGNLEMQLQGREDVEAKGRSSPGVVARLMGLDSVPKTHLGSPDSLTRSRSMNSVECLKEESNQMKMRHRRARSTLWFHETPAYIELEDENFFILSFEKGSESREFSSRERRRKKGTEELRQREVENGKNRENRAAKASGARKHGKAEECDDRVKLVKRGNIEDDGQNNKKVSTVLNENYNPNREVFRCKRSEDSTNSSCLLEKKEEGFLVEAKLRWKKKKKMTEGSVVDDVEHECGSEDSSPVSVLEFDRFIDDREVPETGKGSRSEESKPRRKLSRELETYEPNHVQNDLRTEESGSRKRDGFNESYSEMWSDISRITETEIAESKWIYRRTFEEISEDIESYIIEQLLEETTEQLSDFSRKEQSFVKH